MAKASKTKRFILIMLRLLLLFFIFTVTPVIIFRFIPPPVTPLMFLRSLEYKSDGKDASIDYQWVPVEEMSPYLFQAALAAEDDLFMEHNGFNFNAIKLAYNSNQKNTKRVKGGSTISQQTAKNVFLWPHRDYVRKGLEAYFTTLIEFIWGKKRIMEVYMNVVELGEGVYGVEAASQKYFKKPAKDLTKSEAAAFLAVFPNPRIYHVINPSPYTQRYKYAILRRMAYIKPVKFD
jgi:monofunctional glycosyltransferase